MKENLEALSDPVSKHMRRTFLLLDEGTSVASAAKKMREGGFGSVIVTRGDEPIGIVTERDVLYKVVAEGRDPRVTKLSEVMSSPLVTVSPDTPVIEAIALMSSKGIRRLPVVEGGKVVGVLSQLALIGDVVTKSPVIPEIELEKVVRCPYCNEAFEIVGDLSKHIDNVHVMEDLVSLGKHSIAETYQRAKKKYVR